VQVTNFKKMAACQYHEIRASIMSEQPPITRHPTWDAEVRALFSEPYWTTIDSDPKSIGAHWISQMREYSPSRPAHMHLDLSSIKSVQQNILTIYQHLRSRSMPITKNQNHYWPDEALETLRLWANQGFRCSFADPIQYQELIKAPNHTQINTRVRKDIFSLSPSEIQAYREKLDDVLQVGTKNSKWQELGLLRAF
jgi:hypothetical protein